MDRRKFLSVATTALGAMAADRDALAMPASVDTEPTKLR